MTVKDDLLEKAPEKDLEPLTSAITADSIGASAPKPLALAELLSKRSTRRNRRRGFTPQRRGRPKRTISGGSR
jgi:hypothetical protein